MCYNHIICISACIHIMYYWPKTHGDTLVIC